MRNQMEAHSAVAYLIEQLIYNQKFKFLLKKAISNIKNNRFYRAKDRITYVYNWTNQKIFDTTEVNYSFVEQLASDHMILIANDFAKRNTNQFREKCAKNESFYHMMLGILMSSLENPHALSSEKESAIGLVKRQYESVSPKRSLKVSLRNRSIRR